MFTQDTSDRALTFELDRSRLVPVRATVDGLFLPIVNGKFVHDFTVVDSDRSDLLHGLDTGRRPSSSCEIIR